MKLEIKGLEVYVLERVSHSNGRSYDFDTFNSWSSAYDNICRLMWIDGTEPRPLIEAGEYEISALDPEAHPDHYEIYERHVKDYVFNDAERERLTPTRQRRLKRNRAI